MTLARPATLADLTIVASWINSPEACARWMGADAHYPIDLARFPAAMEFGSGECWILEEDGEAVAFGQLVEKAGRRGHVARLIIEPSRRGRGVGGILARGLLARAAELKLTPISLCVDPGNGVAIGCYRAMGFRESPRPADEPESELTYFELRREPN